MTVWSLAFVWPLNAPFEGEETSCPSYYAHAMIEFIKKHDAESDRFIINVHSSIPDAIISAFVNATNNRPVLVRKCTTHPFSPTAERFVPLLDPIQFTKNETVVVVDIHDDFKIQEKLLHQILENMPHNGAGFTFWPAKSTGGVCPCGLNVHNIPLPIDSCRPDEYHWHFDGGMAISSENFRQIAFKNGGGFGEFLSSFLKTYHFERSAEEVVCEAYLGTILCVIKEYSYICVHRDLKRSVNPSPDLSSYYSQPCYSQNSLDKISLAMEEECEHTLIKEHNRLSWKCPVYVHKTHNLCTRKHS